MLRWLLISLFLVTSLVANTNEALKKADLLSKKEEKTSQFRAYNEYKSIYLKALISEKNSLKISALKGIIKTGNNLHIDVSKYSKELKKLKKQKTQTKNVKTKKKEKVAPKKKKTIKIKPLNKLKKVSWKGDALIMTFDKKMSMKQIDFFTLFNPIKKKHRYVFDIHSSMLIKSKNIKKDYIEKIKLAQFNPDTLRLVIENSKKIRIRYKTRSKNIEIKIIPLTKKVVKKQPAKKVTKNKPTKKSTKKATPQRIDRNKVIVIDAGHGGKDPGAVGYRRYKEKTIVLSIANKLKNILKKRGYKIYMTRSRDNFIRLSHRTQYANKKDADLFISIHANAVGRRNAKKAHGVECYFLSKSRSKKASKVAAKENSADMSDMNRYGKNTFLNFLNHHKILASNKLAIDLQRGMLASLNKHYKVKDGGVREGPFWVLVGAQMPAVLVEVGFISHPTEAKRLANKTYQQRLAKGLANGVERYFANN